VSHREILPREIPKNEILGITMSLTVSWFLDGSLWNISLF
jgi:hypothetical protein